MQTQYEFKLLLLRIQADEILLLEQCDVQHLLLVEELFHQDIDGNLLDLAEDVVLADALRDLANDLLELELHFFHLLLHLTFESFPPKLAEEILVGLELVGRTRLLLLGHPLGHMIFGIPLHTFGALDFDHLGDFELRLQHFQQRSASIKHGRVVLLWSTS
jgi:hypothetical protein